MEEEDYPALYQAADDASLSAQAAFLRCTKGYAALSIAGAGLAVVGIESASSAALAAILFAAALGLAGLMAVKRYENVWYRARAVAESVKTASWRFMMRAEPFAKTATSKNDKRTFAVLLQNVLKEHKDLAHELSGKLAAGEQITKTMLETRQLSLNERMRIYREQRIENQRLWYAGKSKSNKIIGRRWFWVFVGLQSVAIVFTIFRIAYPQYKFWPTEIFVVAAASIFGWIQIKRFRELAAAYGVTAHEIGLAQVQLDDIKSDEAFSNFVGDTENAFSREHTQWIARRDMGT